MQSAPAPRARAAAVLNNQELADLRRELELELRRLTRGVSPVDERAVCDLAPRARARAAQLLEVLRRMDTDSFGVCVSCQSPIAYERLSAIPETTICAECSRSRELAFQG